MKKIALFAFLLLCLSRCSKGSSATDDRILPVINLQTPDNNQQFMAGETVRIEGSITDNNRLVEIHTHISNVVTGALLIDIHRYPTTGTHQLLETFEAQAGIQYRIVVIAKDNSTNESRVTRDIQSN